MFLWQALLLSLSWSKFFFGFVHTQSGDICKMYRCVRVEPEDSHLQCILWRDSTQDQLRVFKLDIVSYGAKPASFLAVRAMHQLSADEHTAFPLGAEVILGDF